MSIFSSQASKDSHCFLTCLRWTIHHISDWLSTCTLYAPLSSACSSRPRHCRPAHPPCPKTVSSRWSTLSHSSLQQPSPLRQSTRPKVSPTSVSSSCVGVFVGPEPGEDIRRRPLGMEARSIQKAEGVDQRHEGVRVSCLHILRSEYPESFYLPFLPENPRRTNVSRIVMYLHKQQSIFLVIPVER